MPGRVTTLRRGRLRAAATAAAALLGVKVLASILWEYRYYFPADFEAAAFLIGRKESFTAAYAAAFYVHIVSGPLVVLLAAFLVASGGKAKLLAAHRWAARALMLLVFAALVPSGLVMAPQAFAGKYAAAGFVALSLATAVTAVATLHYARRRKFVVHRRWALRCFLLLMSPLVLRVVGGALYVLDAEVGWAYVMNAWLSWLVPLVIYEAGWRMHARGSTLPAIVRQQPALAEGMS